jgi:hypothetical protein
MLTCWEFTGVSMALKHFVVELVNTHRRAQTVTDGW